MYLYMIHYKLYLFFKFFFNYKIANQIYHIYMDYPSGIGIMNTFIVMIK